MLNGSIEHFSFILLYGYNGMRVIIEIVAINLDCFLCRLNMLS